MLESEILLLPVGGRYNKGGVAVWRNSEERSAMDIANLFDLPIYLQEVTEITIPTDTHG